MMQNPPRRVGTAGLRATPRYGARRPKEQPLAGQRVVITGAARGLGWEAAKVLAARGARLSLIGLEPELLEERAAALGDRHVWFEADVTDLDALEAAVLGTVQALSGIDVVIANAGIANSGTLAAGPVDAHLRTMDVNVGGTIRTLSACLPHLVESRGYALVVASVGSFSSFPGLGTYCASKAAVEHLAHGLRFEVAHTGVRVGTLHPAFLDTDLVRDTDAEIPSMAAARRRLRGPLGQTVAPEECAVAIADGVERRKRRVYVPRSLAVMQALRSVVMSPLGDVVLRRQLQTRTYIPALEAEVAALGRAFGAASVESGRNRADLHV